VPPTIVRENIRRSIRRLRCFFVRGRCPRLIVCTCSRRISVTVGRSGWDGWAVGLCGNVGVSARAWFALHVAEVGLHRGIPADQQDRGPRTPRNSEYLGPPWIGTPTRPRAVQAIDSVPSHSRPSANGCGGAQRTEDHSLVIVAFFGDRWRQRVPCRSKRNNQRIQMPVPDF
jgi:hypothetical protein